MVNLIPMASQNPWEERAKTHAGGAENQSIHDKIY
jgi:hypothetical protein